MDIPTMWIYNYIESLPEGSVQKVAVTNMLVKYFKEQESENASDAT